MLPTWAPLVTVAVAVLGAVFALLKFPQERAGALIGQQSTVLADMKSLNDDLAATAARIRQERDELLVTVRECNLEVRELRAEIKALRVEMERAA